MTIKCLKQDLVKRQKQKHTHTCSHTLHKTDHKQVAEVMAYNLDAAMAACICPCLPQYVTQLLILTLVCA